MVPGLDKLEKDYAEIDTNKKKNTNIPINPVIITNPDDIGVSYINSYKREKPTETSSLTYNEKLCKIVRKNIITALQNLKTREDVVLYFETTLRYNPMVKNIDMSYGALPPSDTRGISVSIELIDNTNICCDLSFYN